MHLISFLDSMDNFNNFREILIKASFIYFPTCSESVFYVATSADVLLLTALQKSSQMRWKYIFGDCRIKISWRWRIKKRWENWGKGGSAWFEEKLSLLRVNFLHSCLQFPFFSSPTSQFFFLLLYLFFYSFYHSSLVTNFVTPSYLPFSSLSFPFPAFFS